MSSSFPTIKQLVSEIVEIPVDKITSESNFITDLGRDSLDIVEIIMIYEDTTGFEVSDDDIASIKTVGDLERLHQGYVSNVKN